MPLAFVSWRRLRRGRASDILLAARAPTATQPSPRQVTHAARLPLRQLATAARPRASGTRTRLETSPPIPTIRRPLDSALPLRPEPPRARRLLAKESIHARHRKDHAGDRLDVRRGIPRR